MKKYLTLFAMHLKAVMAYRADVLVGAGFTIFRVVLSYLLWKMLIPQGGTLSGFTLPEMVTYSILTTAILPLTASTKPVNAFADDIRTGKFVKYLITPVRPFAVFAASALAGALPSLMLNVLCALLWSGLFHGLLAPLSLTGLLSALPILLLAAVFMTLLNYLIASLAFRFTEVYGLVMIVGTLLEFFSGSLAPLEVLFGTAPVWSPFYYLSGYPVLLLMGRASISMGTALVSMGLWTLVLLLLCLSVARNSRRYFEGVGA